MAQIYKITGYIIDIDEEYFEKDIEATLNRTFPIAKNFHFRESECFDWDDDLAINKIDCDDEELKKYFSQPV